MAKIVTILKFVPLVVAIGVDLLRPARAEYRVATIRARAGRRSMAKLAIPR